MVIERNWANFFLGIIVVLLPFLGLPSSWKSIILVIIGLLIVFFALAPRRLSPIVKQSELFNEKEV